VVWPVRTVDREIELPPLKISRRAPVGPLQRSSLGIGLTTLSNRRLPVPAAAATAGCGAAGRTGPPAALEGQCRASDTRSRPAKRSHADGWVASNQRPKPPPLQTGAPDATPSGVRLWCASPKPGPTHFRGGRFGAANHEPQLFLRPQQPGRRPAVGGHAAPTSIMGSAGKRRAALAVGRTALTQAALAGGPAWKAPVAAGGVPPPPPSGHGRTRQRGDESLPHGGGGGGGTPPPTPRSWWPTDHLDGVDGVAAVSAAAGARPRGAPRRVAEGGIVSARPIYDQATIDSR